METRTSIITCSVLAMIIQPGGAQISWSSLTPALERVANYGYQMFGYDAPKYLDESGEIDVPIVWEPIWNGHVPIGDFVSPLLSYLGSSQGSGYENRVVKGYENRLGFRVAVPYVGDFQVTRELGPGRFMEKLGPGKFIYPGVKEANPHYLHGHEHKHAHHPTKNHDHRHDDPKHHRDPHTQTDMYKGLGNYPWNRRR